MLKIECASQLNKSDLININYLGKIIKQNCVVIDIIQDNHFKKGLIIYLNSSRVELLDLENTEGLFIKKLE